MPQGLIDNIKHKLRKSIQEEYDKEAEIRSQIHIGRTIEGTIFEIIVAIINIALWGLAVYFRNEGAFVWITAAFGTFVSASLCGCAYDPTILANFDLPKNKRQPIHYFLAARYNRLAAVWWGLMAISMQLTHFDRSYFSISIILGALGGIGSIVFHLLLRFKY